RKYALDGALDAGQLKTPLIIQKPIRPFFASPWQFSSALDYHPRNSSANPKPCLCSTEEQPRKNLLTGQNAPNEELPFWSNSLDQSQLGSCYLPPIFPAMSLGLRNVTNDLSHVFGCHMECRRGGVEYSKYGGMGQSYREHFGLFRHCLRSPSGLVGEHSAESWTRRLPQLHFLPMSSLPSCEDAGNLMSQLQSLKASKNRTVEACDIYLSDDGFAVNGMQDYCQPSLAPVY
ncbi:uncharacterized protein N7500_004236, partial [Penicillium coprophilum]|uniref:uncharacterized protein n=1 Tax=Penicillium coprophilum TaxID=36646 RepID=UPI00238FEB91